MKAGKVTSYLLYGMILAAGMLFMLFLVGSNALAQVAPSGQEVTITTYYPAPYGVYHDMVVTNRQSIGDVNGDGSFSLGDMAVYPPGHPQSGNPIPGSLTVNGNVGIGTVEPDSPIHVKSAGLQPEIHLEETMGTHAAQIFFENPNRVWQLGGDGSPDIFFIHQVGQPQDDFVIDANGNVGIGTVSPGCRLDLGGGTLCGSGDIIFEKNGTKLWRMFEDEDGLYVESLKTGKIYRFVLQELEK